MPVEVIETRGEALDAIRIDDGRATSRMRGTEPDLHTALVMHDRSNREISSIGFASCDGRNLFRCHARTVRVSLQRNRAADGNAGGLWLPTRSSSFGSST